MIRLLIKSQLTIFQSTIRFWQVCQWLPLIRIKALTPINKHPREPCSIVNNILPKKLNFTVWMTRKCFAQSASSSILNRNTRLSTARQRVSHIDSFLFQIRQFILFVSNNNLLLSIVIDMKRMVQEMISEVELYESEIPASEELYNKLELKVRKKFNDEIDRLEKSFRRIMEQLEI